MELIKKEIDGRGQNKYMVEPLTALCVVIVIVSVVIVAIVKSNADGRIREVNESYKTLMFQKKSSETRIGLVGEQLAPYLKGWPFKNPREFRLISSPIDGVNFGEDRVTIVEIKTGKAKLSKNQRRIRELIRQGKVSYMEFRVGEKGIDVKETKPIFEL